MYMKNKKGFVVLQLSIFLGLLAFVGILIFEIEISKKKFIDASVIKTDDFIETEKNRALALMEFEKEVIRSNLTLEKLKNKYQSRIYKINIGILYDKEKDMFMTFTRQHGVDIYKVYYDYSIETFENNGIIKEIKFYQV